MNKGRRDQVMPGRAQRVDGDHEVEPGKDRGKPADKNGQALLRSPYVLLKARAEGRVKGPAGVDAAGQHAVQHHLRRR